MRAFAGLCLTTIMAAGCGGGPEARPFVIGNGKQVASLFWRGELTDSRGNLWNVALIPGVATSVEAGVSGASGNAVPQWPQKRNEAALTSPHIGQTRPPSEVWVWPLFNGPASLSDRGPPYQAAGGS